MNNIQTVINEALAKYPKARPIPVTNVAHWSPRDTYANALNLESDRRAYNWSGDTWKAIQYVTRKLNIV